MNIPNAVGWWWRRSIHVRTGTIESWEAVEVVTECDNGRLLIERYNGHRIAASADSPDGMFRYEWEPNLQPEQVRALTEELDRVKDTLQTILPALERASGLKSVEFKGLDSGGISDDELAALAMARAIMERDQ